MTDRPDIVTDTPIADPVPDPDKSKRQAFRRWLLRAALALTIISPLIFIFAGLGARIGLWSWGFGLGTLTREIGPLMLIVTLIVGVIALLCAFLIKPRKGLVIAALAILVPLLGFARLGAVQKTVASLPCIHDITTDTENPPVFTEAILSERAKVERVNSVEYGEKRAPAQGCNFAPDAPTKLVSALQTQSYPEIRTLVLTEAPDVAFGRAEQVARDLGWKIKSSVPEAGTLEATETTFWYGFKDDISIRLRPAQGGGTRVDIRSVSRVGASDIGANAARIKTFLNAMRE